jgi:hypothetical protein
MKMLLTLTTSYIFILSSKAQNNGYFISFVNEGQTLGFNIKTGIETNASISYNGTTPETITCMFINPSAHDTLLITAKDEKGFAAGGQHVFSANAKLAFLYHAPGKGMFLKVMDNAKHEITAGNYFNISKLETKPGGMLEGTFAFTDIVFKNNYGEVTARVKAIKDGKFRTVVSDKDLWARETNTDKIKSANEASNKIFTTLEPTYVIKKIFKPVSKNADGFFVWKPKTSDSIFLSDDGYAYTKYDTVLTYTDSTTKTLMFFYSDFYENKQLMNCHACGALMSCAVFLKQDNSTYQLERLDSNFAYSIAWGEPDPVALVKIGTNKYAVSVSSYDIHQGYAEENISYIKTENFKTIFTAQILNSNTGALMDKGTSVETKIKFIPALNGSEYFILQAVTTGTEENAKGKIVPVNKKEIYYFDKEKGEYVLQTKPGVK